MQTITEKIEYLKSLGLTKAAETIEESASLTSKLNHAYQHYRYLPPSAIQRFQERLRSEAITDERGAVVYKQLAFTRLDQYPTLPPEAMLLALESAKAHGCFDYFEVAHLETIKKLPDPLLLGCITNCADKFFITQWDEDVTITDVLQPDEGWGHGEHAPD